MADVRDTIHSLQQLSNDPSWENAGWLGLDLFGIIPLLGSIKPIFKHADEVGDVVEVVAKHGDEVIDAVEVAVKHGDEVVDAVEVAAKHGDEVGDAVEAFLAGTKVLENFDINDAYVKPKHLASTSGKGAKFLADSKEDAERILRDALEKNNVVSIVAEGVSMQGNQTYEIIIDAGETIGTKGESLIKIILAEDGGMLSAYPKK